MNWSPRWFLFPIFLAYLSLVPAIMAQSIDDFPAKVKWLNVDGSKARTNKEIQSARFFKTFSVTLKYDDISTWPIYKVIALNNEKPTNSTCDVQAHICFFVIRDGMLSGGHFEYLRPNHQETKFIYRLKRNFIPGIKPIPGEKCYFGLLSMDLQECSKLIETTWPETDSPSDSTPQTAVPIAETPAKPATISTPNPPQVPFTSREDYPAKVDWKKVNGSKAKITKTLHWAKFNKNVIKFSNEPLTGWPVHHGKLTHGPGYADLNAYTCFFVIRGGKLTGGKFDWLKVGQNYKGWENILGGYIEGLKPISGETCFFSLVSIDGRESTNLVEGRWP